MTDYQNPRFARLLEHVSHYAIYALVLLLPLAYFPWTVDKLELNKQTLLVLLTSVAVIAWLGGMIVKKHFYGRLNPVYLPALLFGLCIALSASFSQASFLSFIGQAGQEYTSFLSILSFILLFIAGSHVLSQTKVQQKVWGLSLFASAFIGLNVLLGLIGLPSLPTNFIGSPNALALYLLTLSTIGSGLWLVSGEKMAERAIARGAFGVATRIAIIITVIATTAVLLSLDYWMLWVATLLGIGTLFTFALIRAEEFPHSSRFVLPMILFVFAILFLVLPTFLPRRFALEVAPSYKTSFAIARESLADSSWLVGSGPGTFTASYTKFKPLEVNETKLWDIRFDRSGSHLITLLATTGIFGTFTFLLFLFWLLGGGLASLSKNQPHDEWKMTFVTFSGWLILAYATFFSSSNLTLSFLFWILSAILVSQSAAKMKRYAFSSSPRIGLFTAFFFVLINVGLLTVVFISVSRYAAEIAFASAVRTDKQDGELDNVIGKLDTAARLNKLSDIYYRNLSNALLIKTAARINDETANPEELRALIMTSINAAKRAVQIDPTNVVNVALLGDIYREFSPLVGEADSASIEAYKRAIELAPLNPKYHTALGRAYLLRADQFGMLMGSEDAAIAEENRQKRDAELALAVEALLRAQELQKQYAPAHYQLALAYERQGNIPEAIKRMETVRITSQSDVGVALQLGLLYMKAEMFEEAKSELERAVTLAPNFANARWYLADVYNHFGYVEEAIKQLEYLLPQNEGNVLLEQRLERLRAGRVVESFPEPLEEGVVEATDAPAEEPVVAE